MEKFKTSLAARRDPTNVEQTRQTRYAKNGGKWHPADFRVKTECTLLAKHGDAHWNNQEKFRKTSLDRYGTPHPMNCEQVKKAQTDGVRRKYGVDCVFNSDAVRKKTRLGVRKNAWLNLCQSQTVEPVTTEDEFMNLVDINAPDCILFRCRRCGKTFAGSWDNGRTAPCPHCSLFGHGSSVQEDEFLSFLKSAVGPGQAVEVRNRRLIGPLELDAVVTGLDGNATVAFEYDGLYWHCESAKRSASYHMNKTDMCEKAGVRLIHVFENEWISKREIVKSRVRSLLGSCDRTVYARKCGVREVEHTAARDFLDENHLQGAVNSGVSVGLFLDNELIALMTFGKCRFDRKHEWEMLRFCCRLGYRIPGTAGKLLKYFERTYDPKSLVSYADRRWSQENLYRALGFTLVHASRPNYWYFKPHDTKRLYSRVSFQKHKLKRLLENFDENKTEVENMRANGWCRIFDCGNMVFEKTYGN